MSIGIKKWADEYAGAVLLLLLKPVVFIFQKILRRNHDAGLKGEIVFIKMMGGGSLVIALPSLLGLKKKYPGVKFILVCTPAVAVFGKQLGIFDEFVEIQDSGIVRFISSSFSALAATLWSDTVVSLEIYSRMATLFALFTCARNRISFYSDNPFWVRSISTHLIFFDRFSGIYIFYDRLVNLFGANPVTVNECSVQLKNHNKAILSKQREIATGKNAIAINHACSDFLNERMLNMEQWVSFFKKRKPAMLPEATFVFLGTTSDLPAAEKIIKRFKSLEPGFEYINLCGVCQLDESLAVLQNCREFWGIDSGLLHFARLLVPKCVSSWGPTDPVTRLRAIDDLKEEIYYDQAPCSPCAHLSLQTPCHGQNVCIARLFDKSLEVNPEWALTKNKFIRN